MNNVYYNPENFGLKVIGQYDFSSGSYEFDTRIFWADENGAVYTARDAGCSCPTPFEGYRSVAELERINDIKQFKAEFQKEMEDRSYYDGDSRTQITEVLNKVAEVLQGHKI
jgi:hypothetical protein